MKIAVFTKGIGQENHEKIFFELIDKLKSRNHEVFSTNELLTYYNTQKQGDFIKEIKHCDANNKPIDFLICVGGDGTILDALTIVRDSNIPVLGINTGRLGFLANGKSDDLKTVIEQLEKGKYTLDSRTLLAVESSDDLFEYNYGLNDFVIHKKETSSMIVVHTYLNGEFMNSYWADGLIVSTPTGSTGYSLSCGGPIIFPNSENLIITPIAPHNLNVRPVVVSDNYVISFEIEGRASNYMAGLDSRSCSINRESQLAVKKADHQVILVRLPNDNFMDTLRNKLHWGLDKRN